MARLSITGFGNWLLLHREDQTVGFPEDPYDCPLCRYLRALGVPSPLVDLTYYAYYPPGGGEGMEPLAEWATKFQYDSMDLVGTKAHAVKRITAVQALKALNTDFGKRAFRE